MSAPRPAAPLAGFRVLDLTNVLAGPFCCHQLAMLGAEVVKIEAPGGGDLARQLGADPELNARLMGVSFLAQNSGKRSITLNLKSAAGRDILLRLVETADVLVENFRPGVMARLGLDQETLRRVNPELVVCAISGFGQDGPLAAAPAYDQIVQGMAGVMSVTGSPDTGPLRVGYPVADTIGGLTAAFAISAALARPAPGRGTFIDVSMLEAVLSTMGWVLSNFLVAAKVPQPMGNDNFTASPSGTFRTRDGMINVAANQQAQFEALCRVVGRSELASDPRFSQRQARLDNRAALKEALEAALASNDTAHWVALFTRAGVPAGPVLTVPEILRHPQVAQRGLIGEFDDVCGVGGTVRLARPGMRFDHQRPATERPPPELGADTRTILAELGYDADSIETLRADGAI